MAYPTAAQFVLNAQLTALKYPVVEGVAMSNGAFHTPDVSDAYIGRLFPKSSPTAVQCVVSVQLTPEKLPSVCADEMSVGTPHVPFVSTSYIASVMDKS
jgi:hypothetical protein